MPAITDIRAYTALNTDFDPRILARDSSNNILLDGYINITTLAGSSQGAFLIPFRPNQSPQSWMYVAVAEDYQKFSAPDTLNAVTNYKVGIQEPQQPPEAAPLHFAHTGVDETAALWTGGGTAGAITNSTRLTDTIGAVRQDPVNTTETSRWSLQVTSTKNFQIGMPVNISAPIFMATTVLDVLPPINSGNALLIDDVYYYSGTTGRCIIVPRQTAISTSVPNMVGNTPIADSIFSQQSISSLRRGALVTLADYGGGGPEIVMVLSVTSGPNGLIAFECVTTGTFAAGDQVSGVPTVICDHFGITSGGTPGATISATSTDMTLTGSGIGYASQPLATDPFTTVIDGDRGQVLQQDDYIILPIQISDLSKLVLGRLIWNVGSTVDYSTDIYYADFTAADIIAASPQFTISAKSRVPTFNEFLLSAGIDPYATSGQLSTADKQRRLDLQTEYNSLYGNNTDPSMTADNTLYPADLWAIIQLPIRALTRGGNDQNRTLANCNGVRVQIQSSATITVKFCKIELGGGGQPDVGAVGSPYFYAMRARSSLTGAMSNPSPVSRYGVSPRRQQVMVELPEFVGDTQMDTWDIFRYGGTVTTWRYIGSTPITIGASVYFVDDNFDTTILGNDPLDYDNFEPWPSIDLPWIMLGTSTATLHGTAMTVAFASSADVPENILKWLPGTLILISTAVGNTVSSIAFTLWNRPVLISGTTYRFRTVENMGFGTATDVVINEPIVGNKFLPYVWGPDANGTIFASGDTLRPGTLYYAKSNNPDSAPDKFNQELTSPSEPVLGGEILDGLSFAATSLRWFALYPSFENVEQRYQKVQRPVERGLAAPYGHCNNGKTIFFVASDGIWTDGGEMLTAPIKNLFPREGIPGEDVVYGGLTIHAPDYRYVSEFRLSYAKGYLYFDYKDSDGEARTLVLDTTRPKASWVIDEYADPITCHYLIEGPEDNLTTVSAAYKKLIMGDANGQVWSQKELSNDNTTAIAGAIATFEYNGGDIRANQFWGDSFLDSTPQGGLTVTPISDRIAAGVATTVPASALRTRSVVKASGIQAKCLGYLTEWSDDYLHDYLLDPTRLFAWQPMNQGIPINVLSWQTQGTNFGLQGYLHVKELRAAYVANADVTLTITVYDGTAPAAITLPSTGGAYRKIIIPFTFNKGLLYFFAATSTAEWRPYFDAWECLVGQWGRTDQYRVIGDIEQPHGLARSIAPQ